MMNIKTNLPQAAELRKMPRVAAVHDISGYGKCSLTVAIPVLSAAGVEVCPVPAAILSTNTLFSNFTFMDATEHMRACIKHWSSLGLSFNSVYSGFLGSAEQISLVLELIRGFDSGISIVDPVMGDNGNIIKTYTPELCAKMRDLVAAADIATPNVTEACILTGEEFRGNSLGRDEAKRFCEKIKAMGTGSVVLTGTVRGNKLYNCFIEENGAYSEDEVELLDFQMHGTGDLFTSVLTAALMRGFSLPEAVNSAGRFVRDVMLLSLEIEDTAERGVAFEPLVYKLSGGIYRA